MATIPSPRFAITPLYMQAVAGDTPIDYSAEDFRRLHAAIWMSPGIITPTSFHVEQADTPGWAIKIRSGIAVVGNYLVTSYDTITLDVSALNTNPVGTRTHRAYLVIQDKAATASDGTGYYAQVKVTEDFGGGTSGPPDDTYSAILLLAAFNISPGQTSILNQHIASNPRNASHCGDFVNLADTAVTGIGSADVTYPADAGPARARYGAGRVWLSGALRRTNGQPFSTGRTTLGTLPWYLRPLYPVRPIAANTSAVHWRLEIDPDGTMTAVISGDNAPMYLFLDGVSYEID